MLCYIASAPEQFSLPGGGDDIGPFAGVFIVFVVLVGVVGTYIILLWCKRKAEAEEEAANQQRQAATAQSQTGSCPSSVPPRSTDQQPLV